MSLTGSATEHDPAPLGRAEAFAVVVMGGGPAGAVCAMGLAARGIQTLLVDKAVFPRSKVCGCCLNLSAVAALDRCGLGDLPRQLGAVPLVRWSAWSGGISASCQLPGGWSLSREALDHQLLMQAAAAGAIVRTGTAATLARVTDEGVWITLRSAAAEPERVCASVAVVATGLTGGGVERWLPWQQAPAGPLGAGVGLACPDGRWEAGVIYMACGQDGYVGAVMLEDGRIDLAAALRPPTRRPRPSRRTNGQRESGSRRAEGAASLGQRMRAVLLEAGLPDLPGLASAAVAATPQLRRLRQVGNGPLIAIGDAAGYVEPFTGEGMAWAMRSGWSAAECIAAALPSDAQSVGRRWSKQRPRLLRARQLPCRLLSIALSRHFPRRTLFATMRRAPWLAPAVVRYLNRP